MDKRLESRHSSSGDMSEEIKNSVPEDIDSVLQEFIAGSQKQIKKEKEVIRGIEEKIRSSKVDISGENQLKTRSELRIVKEETKIQLCLDNAEEITTFIKELRENNDGNFHESVKEKIDQLYWEQIFNKQTAINNNKNVAGRGEKKVQQLYGYLSYFHSILRCVLDFKKRPTE